MAIAIATLVAVVVVVISSLTRRATIPVAAALTAVYGAAAIAAMIFLDVDVVPGGSVAGGLLALTGMSLLSVLVRLVSERRGPNATNEVAASE